MKKLILIPLPLHDSDGHNHLPPVIADAITECRAFVAENIRTARRWLRKAGYTGNFDETAFYEWNKHGSNPELDNFLKTQLPITPVGMLSEAGCPCIADPGSEVVNLARKFGAEIIPLTGPNSLILALMASGLNGQNFAFNGYLPLKVDERKKKIDLIEQRIRKENQSQIFIETPYRNEAIFNEFIKLNKDFRLSIAVNLTTPEQWIETKKIADWKQIKPPFHKKPAVFILGQ